MAAGAAATRVGLSRIAFASNDDRDSDRGVRTARADYLIGLDDSNRIEELLQAAMQAALAPFRIDSSFGPFHVSLVMPRERPGLPADLGVRLERVARQAVGELPITVTVNRGSGAEALAALVQRAATLRPERAELAIVAATDTLVSADAMDGIMAAGRLHRADQSWGLIPGEGAACLLLATRQMARALGARPLCVLTGFGKARQAPAETPGGALTRALREALAASPPSVVVDRVFADINGERSRSDAWAFSSMRLGDRLHPQVADSVPATAWGDAGAASGVLLVASAASAASAGWLTGPTLIWSADDDSAAAMVIEPDSRPSREALLPRPDGPATHVQYDRELFREVLDHVAALAEQIAYRKEAEETAPLPDWTKAETHEARLDRAMDAFLLGGDLAASVAATAVTDEEAAIVYSATRTLAADNRTEQAVAAFANADRLEPAHADAFAQGLLHAGAQAGRIEIFRRLCADDQLLPAAMAFAWRAHLPVSSSVVGRAARFSPEQMGTALPRAIAFGGSGTDMPYLQPWIFSEDEALKTAAMVALIRHSGSACEQFLRDQTRASWVPVPLALLATPACADILLSLEGVHSESPAYAIALGLLGDLRALPILLRLLAKASVAASAASALVLILGADLTETAEEVEIEPDDSLFEGQLASRRAGDQTIGVTRRTVTRVCRDPGAWRAFWNENQRRFEARHRYRMGRPAGLESDVRALAHPGFPTTLRRWLADALTLVHGAPMAFDTDLPVQQQRRAIERLQRRLRGDEPDKKRGKDE